MSLAEVTTADGDIPLLVNLRSGLRLKREVLLAHERRLAGAVHAGLWLAGGLSLMPLLFISSVADRHELACIVLLGVALLVGTISAVVFRLLARPERFMPPLSVVGVGVLTAATWATGGSHSPAWIYLLVSILYSAYFYPPKLAAVFLVLVVLGLGAPLAYQPSARSGSFVVEWALASSVFLLVSGTIVVGGALSLLYRRRADQHADQERAMRAIASAVLDGTGTDELELIAAREIARVHEGLCFTVLQLDSDERVTVMGLWPPDAIPGLLARDRLAIAGHRLRDAIAGSDATTLTDIAREISIMGEGFQAAIVAPLVVPGVRPRAIVAFARNSESVSIEVAERVMALGAMLQAAIRSVRNQSRLAEQATTDPLTGLANYRSLQSELEQATAQAVRHRLTLAVVAIDLDEFKHINDTVGHDFGDTVIRRVATGMRAAARPEDTIARRGGDEFVWLMPGLSAEAARNRVESARLLVENRHDDGFRVTFSAGVSDARMAATATELLQLADDALYWSKAHGRDQIRIYDALEVAHLSDEERAEVLARSQAHLGLQALARTIDARNPLTRHHSERVADLAGRLARASGWSEERAMLLRDAALVHDIGLVAVPEAVLHRRGELSETQQGQVSRHVELSACIAEGVLGEEQLAWIRQHHERPDGGGYPLGLSGDQIAEGGALLAVANAFDMLMTGGPQSPGRGPHQALARCLAGAGTEFDAGAVAALERVFGELEWAQAPAGAADRALAR